ncbi:corrinoid protein [Desulfosporosinus sp. OT]|uniref:cobalamin B12-binding domain-containing protein n=1 Tax=Desulfosporosinus sp. OT TaxID=913865 RepID=UPI000223B018|nr:corrinoid protein [Desulfosporosinus sp. OT]EGW40980.1 5-methyltetrahydrofolate--homocysteine S-methyltransferase [Desulfosporosinus sp. OT]
MITSELEFITKALIKGQANRVKTLTILAIENGIGPRTILEKALMPGMQEIGRQFRDNIIYISDVLIASRAMYAGLHVLKPFLSNPQQSSLGKVVIGTVAGDLHDIGKNLIVMMLCGAGLEVIDLGIDVQPEDFAQAIIDHQPDILAMSAMLTTTLGMMSETIRELNRRDLRNKVKIIIGGSPATQEYAQTIKADGFAVDVMKAVDLAMKLIKESVKPHKTTHCLVN